MLWNVDTGTRSGASIMAPATPLLFLDDAKASNCQKNNRFSDLGDYSEWPKVAGAVIQARSGTSFACKITVFEIPDLRSRIVRFRASLPLA
jgi:hypothetical protein